MYPPVGIGQVRIAEKHDIVLGGKLHLPAGTIMWVSAALSMSGLTTAGESLQELPPKSTATGLKVSRNLCDLSLAQEFGTAMRVPCAGAPSRHPERLLQLG